MQYVSPIKYSLKAVPKITFCLMMVLGLSITTIAQNPSNSNEKKMQVGVFNSTETISTNMRAFSRWTGMWRRHNLPLRQQEDQVKRTVSMNPRSGLSSTQIRIPKNFRARRDAAARARAGLPPKKASPKSSAPLADDPCNIINSMRCKQNKWNDFVVKNKGDTIAKLDHKLLADVNAFMNRSTYIVDPVNWGVPDYWATPTEFFMKDGDCEDYAISKYITLKRMGVPADTMRLVIVQDENLRIAHAVLSVEMDDKVMILDNQIDAVLSQERIHHYRPVYSINEQAWWLHRKQK